MLSNIIIFISLIFNLVGLYLIVNGTDNFILQYSSLAICFISILVFSFEKNFSLKLLRTFLFIAFVGFIIEVIGVQFGIPFGQYLYGDNLGIKFFDVPLVLGLNWLLLVYVSLNLVSIFKLSIFKQSLLVATLMLLIDSVIEPIASKLGFWYWIDGAAGFYNYLSWFIISFLAVLFFLTRHNIVTNKIAALHYFIYLIFFIALRFFL